MKTQKMVIITEKQFDSKEEYLDYCNDLYTRRISFIRKAGLKVEVLDKTKSA